eukprot:COSAG06_NODE_4512_length_4191_cov_14.122678_2_plen_330_part_00
MWLSLLTRPYTAFPRFEDDDDAPTKQGADGKPEVDIELITARLAECGQRPTAPKKSPAVLFELMQACWVPEIRARPAAAQISKILVQILAKTRITYDQFLDELSLQDEQREKLKTDLAARQDDRLLFPSSPGKELQDLKKMGEDDVKALCETITGEQREIFVAAVQKLRVCTAEPAATASQGATEQPELTYDQFLASVGLAQREEDLAEYLSSPGKELQELTQMTEDDFKADVLDDDDLALTPEQKDAFSTAVQKLREGATSTTESTKEPLWSETEKHWSEEDPNGRRWDDAWTLLEKEFNLKTKVALEGFLQQQLKELSKRQSSNCSN